MIIIIIGPPQQKKKKKGWRKEKSLVHNSMPKNNASQSLNFNCFFLIFASPPNRNQNQNQNQTEPNPYLLFPPFLFVRSN